MMCAFTNKNIMMKKMIRMPIGLLTNLAKLVGILNGNKINITKITKLNISIFFNGFLKAATFGENAIDYVYYDDR
jgi:hypothetical protein